MTIFVPAIPSSNREARSGELAVKYGPSVNSGVSVADWLALPHARVDAPLMSLLVNAVGAVLLVPLLFDIVAVEIGGRF